jgi:hypothetical protein
MAGFLIFCLLGQQPCSLHLNLLPKTVWVDVLPLRMVEPLRSVLLPDLVVAETLLWMML